MQLESLHRRTGLEPAWPSTLSSRAKEASFIQCIPAASRYSRLLRTGIKFRVAYLSTRNAHNGSLTADGRLSTTLHSLYNRIPVRRLLWVPVVLGTVFAGGVYLSVHPDYTEKRRIILTAKGFQRFLRCVAKLLRNPLNRILLVWVF